MAGLVRLKAIRLQTPPGGVIVHRRALERVHLADPDGCIAALLRLLRQGTRTPDALPQALIAEGYRVTGDEVATVLAQFDEWAILERPDADDTLDQAVRERHQSNLRYYDITANLAVTSADQQRAVQAARVLLLGAGGLGSGILQSLAGLGVGFVRLVDFDTVETKNLARQFSYGLAEIGQRKIDAARAWVAGYTGGTVVDAVDRRIATADDIRELAGGMDLVICAIDSPENIQLLINEACFDLDIPFVAGGLAYSTVCYWSVEPGQSPCRMCLELHREDELRTGEDAVTAGLLFEPDPVNRATGPAAQLLSGVMSLEAMRFLRPTDPPVARGCYHVVELADGMVWERHPWERHPACKLCGSRP